MIIILIKLLFIILLSLQLHADKILDSTYYIDSDDINISYIIPEIKNDIKLFKFDKRRYTKRIKSRELIQILNSYNLRGYSSSSRYIKFVKKSPIDNSRIKEAIKDYYELEYDEIEIKDIVIEPRGYIKSLPKRYEVTMTKKSYLSKSSTIHIKTPKNRKIFFDYTISADIPVYVAKNNIRRGTELSLINSAKKSIILDKFRAKPIQKLNKGSIESKQRIKAGNVITQRDVEKLTFIKRGSIVSISLNSDNIFIGFMAKALQNGKLNDIITVQKNDGKKLKVRVTGRNKAEMI